MSGSRQPSASLYTKLKVYRAVLLITLLYSCETWTVYSRHVHANQVKDIHLSCLRRLLHIRWEDKNPDMEVIERAGIPSVDTLLQRAQVRWAGHAPECLVADYQSRYCMENSVKASGLLGQKKRFKDMHQRRPRSLSSTFEGRTTTNTMAENNSHSARSFNSSVCLFVQTKLYWCEQHCFKYKQDMRG